MRACVEAWRSDGDYVEVGGDRIFVRRHDGSGPLRLFLHGFPRAPTTGAGRSQTDIVEELVAGEPRPVVLVGHDMGTSVASELLAADLEGQLGFDLAGVLHEP